MCLALLLILLLPPEPVEVVGPLLGGIEFGGPFSGNNQEKLLKMGTRAFPAFEKLLADPQLDPMHVVRIFNVVEQVDADRSRFLEPAVARLADPHLGPRSQALSLLRKIGSARDTPAVVALLWDERQEGTYAAAHTLAVLGDRRAVTSLDIWLARGNHREPNRRVLREGVAEFRAELVKRLEKEQKEKAKKPPAK